MHSKCCQPKKLTLCLLFLISALALLSSLAFLQISSQPLGKDQYSPFSDPKVKVILEDEKLLYEISDEFQPSLISSSGIRTDEFTDKNGTPTGSEPNNKQGNPKDAVLKVFMYNMPPEFHFGMLDWKPEKSVWPTNLTEIPQYPGGLNLQHSPEYWLTLDLLSSNIPGRNSPCSARRVENSKEADVFFVPFFSSLSYNRHSKVETRGHKSKNELLQEKLVHFLMRQEAWRRSGGKNHVIVMHHPNSMVIAREQLRSAMFIVADFGRYSPLVGNVEKDVVAPYKHVVPSLAKDS